MPIATVSSTTKTANQIVYEVIENIYYPPLWWFRNADPKENPRGCGTEPGN